MAFKPFARTASQFSMNDLSRVSLWALQCKRVRRLRHELSTEGQKKRFGQAGPSFLRHVQYT